MRGRLRFIANLGRDTRGLSSVEYLVILVGVGVLGLLAWTTFSESVDQTTDDATVAILTMEGGKTIGPTIAINGGNGQVIGAPGGSEGSSQPFSNGSNSSNTSNRSVSPSSIHVENDGSILSPTSAPENDNSVFPTGSTRGASPNGNAGNAFINRVTTNALISGRANDNQTPAFIADNSNLGQRVETSSGSDDINWQTVEEDSNDIETANGSFHADANVNHFGPTTISNVKPDQDTVEWNPEAWLLAQDPNQPLLDVHRNTNRQLSTETLYEITSDNPLQLFEFSGPQPREILFDKTELPMVRGTGPPREYPSSTSISERTEAVILATTSFLGFSKVDTYFILGWVKASERNTSETFRQLNEGLSWIWENPDQFVTGTVKVGMQSDSLSEGIQNMIVLGANAAEERLEYLVLEASLQEQVEALGGITHDFMGLQRSMSVADLLIDTTMGTTVDLVIHTSKLRKVAAKADEADGSSSSTSADTTTDPEASDQKRFRWSRLAMRYRNKLFLRWNTRSYRTWTSPN